jgi:hypothetical protein
MQRSELKAAHGAGKKQMACVHYPIPLTPRDATWFYKLYPAGKL